MVRQFLMRQFLVRRLSLRCPYSKPSTATAEDGLRHPASRRRLAGFYSVSIAAVHALRNATIGLRTAIRLTLWLLTLGWKAFEHGNRAQDVDSVIAPLTTDRLQQQKRKHMFFQKIAGSRAIGFLPATFPAVKFLEKPAPRGSGKGSHKYLLERTILTLCKMQSCSRKAQIPLA